MVDCAALRAVAVCFTLAALTLSPAIVLADVTTDGSLGPALELGGPDFEIPADLGTQVGGNLFHSFGTFDLQTAGGVSESATFTDVGASGPIERVVGRVTGGDVSVIDGALRSTIPEADVYLLNPSGVVFGEHAVLDVPASFFVTTADSLGFPNGERFEARPGGAVPLLAVAPPVAWGFLSEQPAGISIDRGDLALSPGSTLSFIGGDWLGVGADGFDPENAQVPSGRIEIVSVGGPGEVLRAGEGLEATLDASGFESLGSVGLRTGDVETSGGAHGKIVIRAGSLEIEEAEVRATNRLGGEGPELAIDVDLRGHLVVRDGAIDASGHAEGQAGSIRIRAGGSLLAEDDAKVVAESWSFVHAGDLDIDAASVHVTDGSLVSTAARSVGDAGDLRIQADTVEVVRDSLIRAAALSGGAGGTIDIDAEQVVVGGVVRHPTGITVEARGSGPAGRIAIDAQRLELFGGGRISARAQGSGDAGEIVVRADLVEVLTAAAFDASSFGSNGGRVDIESSEVRFDSQQPVTGIRVGGPGGGQIEIRAERFSMSGPGTQLVGPEGDPDPSQPGVRLVVGELSLDDGATLLSNGGNTAGIEILASTLRVSGSSIQSLASGGSGGDAGDIRIRADDVELSDLGLIAASTQTAGDAGNVDIEATRSIHLRDGAGIFAQVDFGATGQAGDIRLRAPDVVLDGDANVSTSSLVALGRAGDIELTGIERLRVEGGAILSASSLGGSAGSITVDASESVRIRGGSPIDLARFLALGLPGPSGLFAATGLIGGSRGRITVSAPLIELAEGGSIGSITIGPTPAGDVILEGERVRLESGGLLDTSSATPDLDIVRDFLDSDLAAAIPPAVRQFVLLAVANTNPGDAGNVTVTASESIELVGADARGATSRIRSASTGAGDAGRISLAAPLVSIQGGSLATIPFPGVQTGNAGSIAIDAGRVQLGEGGRIDSSTFGAGQGGSIEILASESIDVVGPGSGVFATTAAAGRGGDVTLVAPHIAVEQGGTVSSAAQRGATAVQQVFRDGIDAGLVPPFEPAAEVTGDAGVVTLAAGQSMIVSAGSVTTQTTGQGAAGAIELGSPVLHIVDAGEVRASTSGSGLGGSITLEVGELHMSGEARIEATSESAAPAGTIAIAAQGPVVLTASSLATEARDGRGGDIHVSSAAVLHVTEGGAITASATGALPGGSVTLHADDLVLSGDSEVAARNQGSGDAGTVEVASRRGVSLSQSRITTEAAQASGGNVAVQPGGGLTLSAGEISASVGSGSGGNVDIDRSFVVLERGSQIVARAGEGTGGSIRIATQVFLASPDSLVDASADLGIDGTVAIQAPDVDLSGALAVLPRSFLDAADLFGERCAARRAGAGSSFTVGAHGGGAAGPDGPLWVSVAARGPSAAASTRPLPRLVRHPGPSLLAATFPCH